MGAQDPPVPTVSQDQIDAIKELSQVMKELVASTKAARQAAGDTTTQMSDQIDIIGQLNAATDNQVASQERARQEEENRERSRERLIKSMLQEAKQVDSISKATRLAEKAWAQFAKENKKTAFAVGTATAAIKGFGTSLKIVGAVFKGIFGVVGSFTDVIKDMSLAIISIPFKFFDHLWGRTKKLMSGGTELAQAWENVRENFGSLKTGMGAAVVDIGKNLTQGLITPTLSARKVFGDLAEATEYANEVASQSPQAFQQIIGQFEGKNATEILAMAKGLGVAAEDLGSLMKKSIAEGRGMEEMLAETTKYAKGMADAFGLNSKMISRDMTKAMKDVRHFANMTEKEMAEATVYAHKLGLSLEDITGILDSFNTFEQASENVAKLSQAFGVNIDAMKMLEAKSPADALDMLKSSFAAAGKSAETMNRHELQLIAQSVGMSEEAVRQGLSMKNVGVSMNQVKAASSGLEKQTMDTNQALKAMTEDIKRVVKAGEPPEGDNFFEVFLNSVIEGHDRSKPMIALYKTMAKAIVTVQVEGRKLGDMFVNMFPGYKEFIGGLTQKFSTVGLLFREIRLSFGEMFKDLADPSIQNPVERLLERLKQNFENFFGGKGNSSMLSGLSKMWEAAKTIIADGIRVLSNYVAEGMTALTNVISGKTDTSGIGGFFESAAEEVSPITDALGKAISKISRKFGDLLGAVWDHIITTENMKKLGSGIASAFGYAWDSMGSWLKGAVLLSVFGAPFLNVIKFAFGGPLLRSIMGKTITLAFQSGAQSAAPILTAAMRAGAGAPGRVSLAYPEGYAGHTARRAALRRGAPVPPTPTPGRFARFGGVGGILGMASTAAGLGMMAYGMGDSGAEDATSPQMPPDMTAQEWVASQKPGEAPKPAPEQPTDWGSTAMNAALFAPQAFQAATWAGGKIAGTAAFTAGKTALAGMAGGTVGGAAATGGVIGAGILASAALGGGIYRGVQNYNYFNDPAARKKESDEYADVQKAIQDKSKSFEERAATLKAEKERLEKIMEDEKAGAFMGVIGELTGDRETQIYRDAEARLANQNAMLEELKEEDAKSKRKFIKGTKENSEMLAEELKAKREEADKQILESLGVGENFTVESANVALDKLAKLKKDLDKVDVKGTLKAIKDKFSEIKAEDWTLMSPDQKTKLQEAAQSMSYIKGIFSFAYEAMSSAQMTVPLIEKLGKDKIQKLKEGLVSLLETAKEVPKVLETFGDRDVIVTDEEAGMSQDMTAIAAARVGDSNQIIEGTKTNVENIKAVFENLQNIASTATSLAAKVAPLVKNKENLKRDFKTAVEVIRDVMKSFDDTMLDAKPGAAPPGVQNWASAMQDGAPKKDAATSFSFEDIKKKATGLKDAGEELKTALVDIEALPAAINNTNRKLQAATKAGLVESIKNIGVLLGPASNSGSIIAAIGTPGDFKKAAENISTWVTDFLLALNEVMLLTEKEEFVSLPAYVPLYEQMGDDFKVISDQINSVIQGSAGSVNAMVTTSESLQQKMSTANADIIPLLTATADTFFVNFQTVASKLMAIPEADVEAARLRVSKMKETLEGYSKVLSDIDLGTKTASVMIRGKTGKVSQTTPYEIPLKGGITMKLEVQVNMSATDIANGLVKVPTNPIRLAIDNAAGGYKVDGTRGGK